MVDMTLRLAAKGVIPQPLHFNFVMGVNGGIAATHTNLLFLVNSLPQNATFTVSGTGRAQLPMAVMSMLLGGHVRVGFEDNVYLSKGRLLKSNGEMVEKSCALPKSWGGKSPRPTRRANYSAYLKILIQTRRRHIWKSRETNTELTALYSPRACLRRRR